MSAGSRRRCGRSGLHRAGRGVQDGNAGAERLSAGVSFHGTARLAPAVALGGMPHSAAGCPARVLWWFVLLGEGLCLAGIAGQMEWSHLLEPDAVQLARLPRVPLYAEYLLWPLLIEEPAPRRVLFFRG